MEQIIYCRPAYDRRDVDQGIHGVDMVWILKGPKGAIEFVIYTNWDLPHIVEETKTRKGLRCRPLSPYPANIGYHSPVQQFEEQSLGAQECDFLDGKPCYTGGSVIEARNVFDILLKDGSDGVWKEMERRYVKMFGAEEE